MIATADLMAESKRKPGRPKVTIRRESIVNLKGVPEYKTWLDEFADHCGLNLSDTTARSPLYRAAFFPFVLVASMGTPVGAAQGAADAFLERLPGRKITYTQQFQSDAQITHIALAEAAAATTAARLLRDDLAARVTAAAESDRGLSIAERAAIKGESSEVVRLARTAVRRLFDLSTASSIQDSVGIQRFERDIEALSLHGALAFNTNYEVHGRVLAGLDAGTPFL